MSVASNVDFIIDKGTDWFVEMYWTDYANQPYTVLAPMRMEIRANTGQVVAELFSHGPETPEGEDVTILHNSESGLIQLQLSAAATDKIGAGIYDYDLFVTYSDKTSENSTRLGKLVYGKVHVRGRVTQVL